MTHLTTPELIRALGGADAICKAGCSCRGSYAGPERRSVHRDAIEKLGGHIELDAGALAGRGSIASRVAPSSPVPNDCKYCGGTGTLVYQDEAQPCYCQAEAAAAREAL